MLVCSLLLGACSLTATTGGEPQLEAEAPRPVATTDTRAPDQEIVVDEVAPCAGLASEELARIRSDRLSEASGLAISEQYPGVIWTHNDNGRAPAVIAVDFDGRELGEFPLADITGVDIEDLALVEGVLYLGDIGDNLSQRDEIAVYRFPEPDPSTAGAAVSSVETIRLTYPDRAFDAEALLVDPVSGELIIITKHVKITIGGGSGPLSAAAAPVFALDPPFSVGAVTELEERGVVALDQLGDIATGESPPGTIADLGLADVATGADVRADGARIALRTYRSVWLFDRAPGQSIAEALGGTPCEAPVAFEAQGEAIAFLGASSDGFITVSEGTDPAINVTR